MKTRQQPCLFYNRCHHYQEKKEKHLPYQILQLQKQGSLLQQVSLEYKNEVKKLVLVLSTSMLIIAAREEAVEPAKTDMTIGAAGTGEDGADGEYLGTNLV